MIWQVAKKVDELDVRLRDDQDSSMHALEALLASSPHAPGGPATAAPVAGRA